MPAPQKKALGDEWERVEPDVEEAILYADAVGAFSRQVVSRSESLLEATAELIRAEWK